MFCPRCVSQKRIKAGFINGRQRYRCKGCSFFFTVTLKSTAYTKEVKRIALQMYLEGLGFNAIGRILRVSHVSVLKWIKRYGQQAEELRSQEKLEVVEIDEMHSYIGQKKTIYGYGLLLIDMEKDFSTSFWATAVGKRVKNYGVKFPQKRLDKS